jgi:hypothetical protein
MRDQSMKNRSFGPLQFKQTGPLKSVAIEKDYDLCLVTLSWEQRATFAFLSDGCQLNSAIALWFESTSDEIEGRKSAQFDSLRTKIGNVDELRLCEATEIDENFGKLKEFFEQKFKELGRPLKVILDISCLPKNYLLFLIGFGFSQDIFACFDCLYSAGKYDLMSSVNSSSDEAGRIHRALTSSGKWTSRQIPFLAAESTFPDTRDLTILMGGEIGMALPLVAKIEPSRLSVIFIDETAPGESENKLVEEMQAYHTLIGDYDADEVRIPLGDALSVAEHLENICSDSESECITLMVLGSKSHALAAGIVGLSCSNADVVCRVPKSYLTLDVHAAGGIFFYEIEDRFEPSNYL